MRSCYVTSVLCDKDGKYFAEMHTQLEKALGFEKGSEVYFSWLEKEIKIGGKTETRSELIVTSILPAAWDNLYDLEFHLGDYPGSLTSVAEILAMNGINILIAQSRTTMREKEAEWTMSADFGRFDGDPEEFKEFLKNEIDENPDKDRSEYLKSRILQIPSGKGSGDYVQIKRSELHRVRREVSKHGKVIPFRERSTSIQPRIIRDREVDTLEFPLWVIQALSKILHTDPLNIDAVVMIADTEQSLLRLWFPRPTEKIAKIFFEIDYKPGSLFEMAKFLSDRGVNLLETDLNILVAGDKGVWKIAANINGKLEFPCVYSSCRSHGELERRLIADMREVGIETLRDIIYSEEVGIWARKPIWNLPHEREIAIERGQLEEAEEFLQKYFNSFSSNVKAILPYMDRTTFDYLNQIPKCCGIGVVTSVVRDKTECLKKAKRLAEDRPFLKILEIIVKTEEDNYTPLEHMRWICDDNFFVILETDLKRSSLDGKDYSIEVKETRECGGRTKNFEKRWGQSRPELEEEFRTTVVSKFFYP
jgi:hypothetical protein